MAGAGMGIWGVYGVGVGMWYFGGVYGWEGSLHV